MLCPLASYSSSMQIAVIDDGPSWALTYDIQSHHCHQYILESHYNSQKIGCTVHCHTGLLSLDPDR